MKRLPDDFDSLRDSILKEVAAIEGFLSPKEMRFLVLLGACPTAKGEILEIGSFKGRSTVILAKASAAAGDKGIVAVDPLTAPAETDPDLRGDESSLKDFMGNIERHRVADRIEFYQSFSHTVAETWTRPLRLLWIDGDHTCQGAKSDLEGFSPHLADGAVVAIHDVLHEYEGPVRVFMEDILLSPNYGACGFCGSIAWAQFHRNPQYCESFLKEKLRLYRKLSRLIQYVVFKDKMGRIEKRIYKLKRWRLASGEVDPQVWLKTIR